MSAPTPAPALTDEQVDNMAGTFCDAYLRTLPKFGHPVGKDLFRRWLAAAITRAKREAATYIAQTLAADALSADTAGQSEDYIAGVTHGQIVALRVARENGANHV